MGGFAPLPQTFEEYFRCYPIAMMNDGIRKDDANYGGKIFLPPSALNKLSMLNIRYPMLFELTSSGSGRTTHGGVLEFIAEEGRAYLPQWMLETLKAQPGSLLKITSTDVPMGQFVKLEPQSVDFLDISDPKAVLENVLRNFSTLTVDDIVEIKYNNKIYRIKIIEVKPESSSRSICVIETDLITDFAPPMGYVEPDYKTLQEQQNAKKKEKKFDPSSIELGSMSRRIDYPNILKNANADHTNFVGAGRKLSEKRTSNNEGKVDVGKIALSLEGQPAKLDLPDGQLFFGFPVVPPRTDGESNKDSAKDSVFKGEGQSLRNSNKRKVKKQTKSEAGTSSGAPEVIEID